MLLKQTKAFNNQWSFSFFFQLYTGSKLFCFKLLCLHQFSSLLTAILHFVLFRGSATLVEGLSCALWWGGWSWLKSPASPPRAHSQCLGTDTQHNVGTPKWQKAAPAWLVAPQWFLQSWENSPVKTGHCHTNRDEFLNRLAQQQIPILQPGLMFICTKAQSSILHFIFG